MTTKKNSESIDLKAHYEEVHDIIRGQGDELKPQAKKIGKRKELLIKELAREMVFLGMMEGNKNEYRDPSVLRGREGSSYRGVINKRLKPGLIMEYIFSTEDDSIRSFHLNNVEIDLSDIEETKLEKLLIIIKFYNEKYRQKDPGNAEEDRELSEQEKLRLSYEKKEEAKRKLVLGKL